MGTDLQNGGRYRLYNIDIGGVSIVRAKDGLALSSRNSYLAVDEHKIAPQIHMIMNALAQQLVNGERHIDEILKNKRQGNSVHRFYLGCIVYPR